MIAFIMSLINPLAVVAKQLIEAKTQRLDADTKQAEIEADVTIAQLESRQSIILAEQGSRMTRWIRPAFALPFVIYNLKVIVWDKVLHLGVTDALPAEFWQLQMIVFGAYFVTRGLGKK